MRKEEQAKRKQSNLVSTSSSPRVPSSACGASGFWGGIWTAAGGSCTTRGSCCGGGFCWFCWTGSISGWGNWTSGMTNSRGACNKIQKSSHCFAERTEQEGVFYSDLVFIGKLRHITHVTARPVTYGVSFWGILTSHLITSVMNSISTWKRF